MEDCIFCKIVKGKISEEKIFENDNFFAIADINPLTKGHVLIISKKHFKNTLDIPNSLGQEFLECIKKVSLNFMKDDVEGFNVIGNNFKVAGQVVDHFHYHIIPRRRNDGINIASK